MGREESLTPKGQCKRLPSCRAQEDPQKGRASERVWRSPIPPALRRSYGVTPSDVA